MSVLAVIGTYQHRIDTIVCFSEGWKSGFVLCKLNKVQACTPPSFPFFFWAVWASGNDALKSEMTAQIPIRLLTDYWFHEKSARCPSSYPKAFRLLPKSGSSKVCFELLKTFRVTPRKPCRLVAPPKSGNLFLTCGNRALFLVLDAVLFHLAV